VEAEVEGYFEGVVWEMTNAELPGELKCCGKCRFHEWDDGDDYTCENPESVNYTEYTLYGDSCDDYKTR